MKLDVVFQIISPEVEDKIEDGWVVVKKEDELTTIVEEELNCNVSDDDFEWWEEYKDTGLVPQECMDEMVYDFFDTGELKWVS